MLTTTKQKRTNWKKRALEAEARLVDAKSDLAGLTAIVDLGGGIAIYSGSGGLPALYIPASVLKVKP